MMKLTSLVLVSQKRSRRYVHTTANESLQSWITEIQKKKFIQNDEITSSPVHNLNLTLDRGDPIPKFGGSVTFHE